jgi:hypothetical protein
MDNIWYLYTFDLILVLSLLYACCKKNTDDEVYIALPDDHKYDPQLIEAQALYDE